MVAGRGTSVVNAVNVGLGGIFEDLVFVRDFVSFVRDLCATCARLCARLVRDLCATCAPFVRDLVRELCAEQMSRSASEQKRNEPRVYLSSFQKLAALSEPQLSVSKQPPRKREFELKFKGNQ